MRCKLALSSSLVLLPVLATIAGCSHEPSDVVTEEAALTDGVSIVDYGTFSRIDYEPRMSLGLDGRVPDDTPRGFEITPDGRHVLFGAYSVSSQSLVASIRYRNLESGKTTSFDGVVARARVKGGLVVVGENADETRFISDSGEAGPVVQDPSRGWNFAGVGPDRQTAVIGRVDASTFHFVFGGADVRSQVFVPGRGPDTRKVLVVDHGSRAIYPSTQPTTTSSGLDYGHLAITELKSSGAVLNNRIEIGGQPTHPLSILGEQYRGGPQYRGTILMGDDRRVASVEYETGIGHWVSDTSRSEYLCGKQHAERLNLVYTIGELPSAGQPEGAPLTFAVQVFDRMHPELGAKTLRTMTSPVPTAATWQSCATRAGLTVTDDGKFVVYMAPQATRGTFSLRASRTDGTGAEIDLGADSLVSDAANTRFVSGPRSVIAYAKADGYEVADLESGERFHTSLPPGAVPRAIAISLAGDTFAVATETHRQGDVDSQGNPAIDHGVIDVIVASKSGDTKRHIADARLETSYQRLAPTHDNGFLFMSSAIRALAPDGEYANPLYRVKGR